MSRNVINGFIVPQNPPTEPPAVQGDVVAVRGDVVGPSRPMYRQVEAVGSGSDGKGSREQPSESEVQVYLKLQMDRPFAGLFAMIAP